MAVRAQRNSVLSSQLAPEAPLIERLASSISMMADSPTSTIAAARRLNRAAGTIATSVLIDSAMEHYRGNFHNKAMWTPLITSSLSIAVSVHGLSDKRHGAHRARDIIYAAAGLIGVIGTGFHLYNVTKKVGGFDWQNIFYSAPLGAPAAMSLAGLMGFMAERVRDNAPAGEPQIFGLPAGRVTAATTALSLLGTTMEAGLLHLRGAFHNPAMLLPVTMPPVAAALLGVATVGDAGKERKVSHYWMAATAAMGVAGVVLHAYGVSRASGGWRNWRQNAFAGPPLPAPPSFTGLALAGIAALALLKEHARD
ncbi:hypothetical protein [Novosphingopyxis sp.]|uniref:hypothetical protein n=1 Tax=Novosphingopyxis sp. TaxID=2709690 RepID=UPI003B5D0113